MRKKFLETDRIYLTEISEEDTALLLELDSDPDVMKHLTAGKPSTVKEIQATMERILQVINKYQYKFGFWLAYEKATNEFIGWFLFRPGKKTPDDVNTIELGYRLKKKFWGKGYATEVSREFLSLGFRDYQVTTIFAITMKANLASQNVMKKLGMKWVEDYIEEDFPGEDKSAVRFEIERSQFQKMVR